MDEWWTNVVSSQDCLDAQPITVTAGQPNCSEAQIVTVTTGGTFPGNNFQVSESITYVVTTEATPYKGGTITGGGLYPLGSQTSLTATPADGYIFIDWSGDINGTTNPITVSVDADKNITANFALESMVQGKIIFPIRADNEEIIFLTM